ncbi:MAG: hypothetical protein OXC18_23290 [Desulfurellaceae bacterium]|nr:hypothetical protein [Desulfurellaceae bacterium]
MPSDVQAEVEVGGGEPVGLEDEGGPVGIDLEEAEGHLWAVRVGDDSLVDALLETVAGIVDEKS